MVNKSTNLPIIVFGIVTDLNCHLLITGVILQSPIIVFGIVTDLNCHLLITGAIIQYTIIVFGFVADIKCHLLITGVILQSLYMYMSTAFANNRCYVTIFDIYI